MNDEEQSIISTYLLRHGPWQAFERAVARLLLHSGFEDVRVIGGSGDGGGDVIAHQFGKRFIFQVKFRSGGSLGEEVADEALKAMQLYKADVPIVVSNTNFSSTLIDRMQLLQKERNIAFQLWGVEELLRRQDSAELRIKEKYGPREYQENAISELQESFLGQNNSGLMVMATGLGKTYTAYKGVETLFNDKKISRVLVLAHQNSLVLQLERASWSVLNKNQSTAIWNSNEHGDIESADMVFACIDSVFASIEADKFSDFDLVIIDEAHHAGARMYREFIEHSAAGSEAGPYLLGLTATPWRSDDVEIQSLFEDNICKIDLVQGLSMGYLANIDYKLHVDNLDWNELADSRETTPGMLNKKVFIEEWNDEIIKKIQDVFNEIKAPRAIVFCNTIQHAHLMKDKISARNVSRTEVLYSGSYNGKTITARDRNLLLSDFSDGRIGIMCVVDMFNEGIDVPDVNVIVFQRVTHSRRIFVQQLGRGLRVSEGKEKVVVLDFVSDVRRIAAAIDIQAGLEGSEKYLKLGKPIKFIQENTETPEAENFFKEWLKDVAAIEGAGDDDHVLKYPPNPKEYDLK